MPVFEVVTFFGFSPDGGVTHRYSVVGDTTKPVIVLLPGFSDTHSHFGKISSLLQRNYCVIVPELPGWADASSSPAPLKIQQYAVYLKQLVAFLGLKSVVLAGHCAGSLIALEYALLSPSTVKELFLVSVPQFGGLWPVQLGPVPLRLGKKMRKVREHGGNIQFQISNFKYQIAKEVLEQIHLGVVRFDFRKVGRVKGRVHFIHGGRDPFVRPVHVEKLRGLLPSATMDVLGRAGHRPGEEMSEALAAVIRGYLHGGRR